MTIFDFDWQILFEIGYYVILLSRTIQVIR